MKTAHLFAGGGGGLLADLILGHTPIYALEIDDACCKSLERNKSEWFPELTINCTDIRKFDPTIWRERLDIMHAGIPCPKWSTARSGVGGERFDGWGETLRITTHVKPAYLFLECVRGFGKEHDRVKSDLEKIGYGITEPLYTCASDMGAPHTRERYWAIAYSNNESKPMRQVDAEMAILPPVDAGMWWETPPGIPRVDDGMANRVQRFKMTGNGQVPVQAAATWLMLGGPHNVC
jgi:DNA (cytosine-5)-methyltransferase 1